MNSEKISLNGDICEWRDSGFRPEELLVTASVYTRIFTVGYKPLYLQRRLDYAADSFKALYGLRPQLSAAETEEQISALLYYGLYPEAGNTVDLFLIPQALGGSPDALLTFHQSTPYDVYALMSLKATAIIVNYEIPFEGHFTTLSASAARFADSYALRSNANLALRATRAGTLVSSGDFPLFAVRRDAVLATPVQNGGRLSVERELMEEACAEAKVKFCEEALSTESIDRYEEMMIFGPAGLQSIRQVGETTFHNITATKLEGVLEKLTRRGFSR